MITGAAGLGTRDEAAAALAPVLAGRPAWRRAFALLAEPDRVVRFRIAWTDDSGELRVNRGWRVQHSRALGPYKGGLRFHATVGEPILRELAFEQCFKNALTGLALGGAKGGSDFDSHGRSEGEVRRFCAAFARELEPSLGPELDVPAGDLGVGEREVGWMVGALSRPDAARCFTGKPAVLGGSALRPQATGYGLVYFVEEMLAREGRGLEGLAVAVSGAGAVALGAAEKARELGARVVTVSDTGGTAWAKGGFDAAQLARLRLLRQRRGRVQDFAREAGACYLPGERPWSRPADIALPCAAENELAEGDAEALARNGVRLVAEGANLPCTPQALARLLEAGVRYAPGKAANAGGVAVSGMEMAQNASRQAWSAAEVDRQLREVMRGIHQRCAAQGAQPDGRIDYGLGAWRAGFARLAEALEASGQA